MDDTTLILFGIVLCAMILAIIYTQSANDSINLLITKANASRAKRALISGGKVVGSIKAANPSGGHVSDIGLDTSEFPTDRLF
jgi:hypothetical protein